jgi:inorganic phosphate transporter, PiT family
MDPVLVLFILALCVGFYMAWSIGANDVANAMGTSVGSGALTLKHAVIFAAVLEFCGAYFLGSNVSQTIREGIINPEMFALNPMDLAYGLVASLLAAGVWLQVASFFGWPVSTTHSIVGAVLGFGLLKGGVTAVNWGQMSSIVGSWIISPLLGGGIAFILFLFLKNQIFYSSHPLEKTKRILPYLVFFVLFMLCLVLFFKGMKHGNLYFSAWSIILLSAFASLIFGVISYFLVRRISVEKSIKKEGKLRRNPQIEISFNKILKHLDRIRGFTHGEMEYQASLLMSQVESLQDNYCYESDLGAQVSESKIVERIFGYLQIVSAGVMAFAHGANDVANAIGPLAGVVNILQSGEVTSQSSIPAWVLLLGGGGIVVGLATWGWRVIETVGKKITELTPSRGFTAEFAASITILFASKLGLPISTTHTLVGAVLGVGIARGIGSLNLLVIRDIAVSWVITVPMGALLSIIFYKVIEFSFN